MIVNSMYMGFDDGGGGGDSPDFFAKDILVGSSSGVYITTPIDKELVDNQYYIVSLLDSDKNTTSSSMIYYGSGSQNYNLTAVDSSYRYTLTLTSTTAGLTYYNSAWRNIYLRLSIVNQSSGVIYTTS